MTDPIPSTVENLAQQRTRILLAALIYGGLWQISRIIGDMTSNGRLLPGQWIYALWLVSVIGWTGWMIALIRINRFGSLVRKNPELSGALGDEFYEQIRLKSLAWAFTGALICQAALIGVSVFHPFSALVGADISIFVICTTAISTFLWLERQ